MPDPLPAATPWHHTPAVRAILSRCHRSDFRAVADQQWDTSVRTDWRPNRDGSHELFDALTDARYAYVDALAGGSFSQCEARDGCVGALHYCDVARGAPSVTAVLAERFAAEARMIGQAA